MPMGLRLTISDSMERVLPDDTNVNGLGTWYVTLLVRIASTLAWYGGKDDNATHDTDKAPNKNSFHREQVHMHTKLSMPRFEWISPKQEDGVRIEKGWRDSSVTCQRTRNDAFALCPKMPTGTFVKSNRMAFSESIKTLQVRWL